MVAFDKLGPATWEPDLVLGKGIVEHLNGGGELFVESLGEELALGVVGGELSRDETALCLPTATCERADKLLYG